MGASGCDPATSLAGCRRLIVLGTSGSGKTTLAKTLATLIDAPCVELDALNWGPNWTAADTATFRAQVAAATAGERWVVDGGYTSVRDLLWPRADAIIWLDYPIGVNLWRLFWRVCRRIRSKEELWNGNRESFRANFLSRDSLFVWACRRTTRGGGNTSGYLPARTMRRCLLCGSARRAQPSVGCKLLGGDNQTARDIATAIVAYFIPY